MLKKNNIERILRAKSPITILNWGLQRSMGILTSQMRDFPNLLIIGAQRAGTTSLFKYITGHPCIFPSFPKEVHFFSNNYPKGQGWYRSHFALRTSIKKSERKFNCQSIICESTPYYLFHPLAASRAHALIPNTKLIVLLRDPIDRAYSHYHHEINSGVENLSFEEAIEREPDRLSGEVDRIRNEEHYKSFNYQHFSYLTRGIYANQLATWQQFFEKERILVVKSEDFYHDPEKIVNQVFSFLKLPPEPTTIQFKKYNAAQYRQLDTNTRERLSQIFQPHNQDLYDLLGINFQWT